MSELSDLTLNFSPRQQTGTSPSKQLRNQGRIPAVLYGKETNRSLSVDDKEIRILLRKASGTSSLMRLLGEDGEDELVLIKDLQKDQIRDKILHIDFIQVTRGEELQTRIPLILVGDADGVKNQGGILEVLANEVEVRCRPSKLPNQIELDITSLSLGENLQIKDIPEIEGVSFVEPLDSNLVSCVGSASGRSGAEDSEDDAAGEPTESDVQNDSTSSSEEDSADA